MSKPKRRWVFDQELLLQIETAVARGADTNREIAECIGMTEKTFANYRYARSGEASYKPCAVAIEEAIKKGRRRRAERLLSLAEDAIARMITTEEYQEKTIEHRTRKGEPPVVIERVTTRVRHPNPVLLMFVAVNAADALETGRESIRWKHIQRIFQHQQPINKSAILEAIDSLTNDTQQTAA